MENDWAARLEDGEKVFVHIETDGVERPNAYIWGDLRITGWYA